MQTILTSVKDPVWADNTNTMINCVITTSQFGDEQLPFTAYQHDVEEHGRAIFARLVAGEFGEIAEYIPPEPSPTPPSGEISVTEA